jgi:ABC-type multidrug transport system ATPase subunit
MNVLMGKYPKTQGHLYINGTEGELSTYKKMMGYVPQEDIMYRELTVRENLTHSARTRLPPSFSDTQISELVDALLDILNLSHIQFTPIGTDLVRGISGGQRKRVNIAMELVSLPAILFLDEPTSGLDSSAALSITHTLRNISETLGITVVAVIHQPRFEIFQAFERLLVVGGRGQTAFLGPTRCLVSYLGAVGFDMVDSSVNPADWVMDLLAEGRATKRILEAWEERGVELVEELSGGLKKNAVKEKQQDNEFEDQDGSESLMALQRILKGRGAGFMKQIQLNHDRSCLSQYRSIDSFFLELLIASMAGAMVCVIPHSFHPILILSFDFN